MPAWDLPSSSSICLIRDVLLAREEPVIMKAFEESDGRQDLRFSWTVLEP